MQFLEAARDVGAEIMTQTRIKDYEFNGGVTVKTSNGDFKGKMVVGATGPADKLASMIREKKKHQTLERQPNGNCTDVGTARWKRIY